MLKHSYNKRSFRKVILIPVICVILTFGIFVHTGYAFWIWTPQDNKAVNPKTAGKDTPEEQYKWAMGFFEKQDFKRAAEEFLRLVDQFEDSDIAPDAQYYAGRSYEELGKYYIAFENYQKTIDNYPFTKRLKEIIDRQFNIAKIFQMKESPRLMDLELNDALGKAVEIYKKVISNSTFGEHAEESLYNMADCYRRMMKYSEAMDAYNRLITDYPSSSLIDDSKYQLAYTTYEASLDPEYDQASTDKALEKFRTIAKTTPVPRIAEEAGMAIDILRNKKADSIMNVAAFYEKQKRYDSAVVYYRDVVDQYPDTDSAKLAELKINEIEGRL